MRHSGGYALYKALLQDKGVFWGDMRKMCIDTASSGLTCKSAKSHREGFHMLQATHTHKTCKMVSVDVGEVRMTNTGGHKFVLILTDTCTKFTFLRNLTSALKRRPCTYRVPDLHGHRMARQDPHGERSRVQRTGSSVCLASWAQNTS